MMFLLLLFIQILENESYRMCNHEPTYPLDLEWLEQNRPVHHVSGGEVVSLVEFPHMALVGYKPKDKIKWNCGGSLISENFILTAAHCLSHYEYGEAKVVWLGVTNIKNTDHLQEIEVKETIPHPKYTKSLIYHDIGLLKLSTNAIFNEYVSPANVYLGDDITSLRSHPVVTGWGEVRKDSGRSSENLLKADLEFFDMKKCNFLYRRSIRRPFSKMRNGILEDLMICAGSTSSIKDTCQGDSGGPLQIYDGEKYVVVGVTSYGKACGLTKNSPGIYTKVFTYLQWIEEHVWHDYNCI